MRGDSMLRGLSPEALIPTASSLRVRDDRLPLSGNERDHLFLNEVREGRGFLEASGLSGLDHPGDGRSLVLLDLDRDGAQDVAVASANAPLLQVYRNGAAGQAPRFVAVRCEGGNHSAVPVRGLAPRDGVGARVTVEVGERAHVREVSRGQGLAAQNAATLLVGLGEAESAARVVVRWPSGREQVARDVAAGTLLTVREAGEVSRQPYRTRPQ